MGGLIGSNSIVIAPLPGLLLSQVMSLASGAVNIGGVTGVNAVGGVLTNLQYTGSSVSSPGGSRIGGLVGLNAASITDSFATTSVSGGSLVGGLIGQALAGSTLTSTAPGLVFFTGNVTGTGSNIGVLIGSNAGTIIGAISVIMNVSGSSTIDSVISNVSSFIKNGAGTLILSGANTYTGPTVVNGGTLIVTNASGLGTTAGGTTVNAGAALTISGVNIVGENVTLNNATLNGTGVAGLTGAVTLGSGTSDVIAANSGSFTLSGAIDGNASLILQGAGNLVLSSNIGSGTPLTSLTVNTALNLGSSASLTANTININDGVAGGGNNLALNGTSVSLTGAVTVNNISVSGAGISNSFSLNNGNPQIFTVSGPNISSMTTSGITGNISLINVQSFSGGTSANQYIFTGNGSLSETISGNGGTLNFSGYGAPVIDTLLQSLRVEVVSGGTTILTHTAMANLIGTGGQSLLILTPEQLRQATSTGPLSGIIGDPLFWSGFTVNFSFLLLYYPSDISGILQGPLCGSEC